MKNANQNVILGYPKIWPMLKFFKNGPNFKVKRSRIMVSIERSGHKEHTYEI
jgi:hypothetical protein